MDTAFWFWHGRLHRPVGLHPIAKPPRWAQLSFRFENRFWADTSVCSDYNHNEKQIEGNKMKNAKTVCKTILITGLAVAVLTWLPAPAHAQDKGAYMLKKIQTVEDVQQIEPGDTIVMSCPKCKDTYVQVVEKSWHAATADQLKTVGMHLCSS